MGLPTAPPFHLISLPFPSLPFPSLPIPFPLSPHFPLFFPLLLPLPLSLPSLPLHLFLPQRPSTPYQMCVATVVGLAFLMHQVRCMMSLLFLVGSGLEQPSVISHMLDLQRCPNKPQYGMAMPEPLVLYECCFEGLEWQREEKAGQKMVEHFQHLWTRQAVK